jgi:hypothetical protein
MSVKFGDELMFPTKYVKADELKGRDVTVTVASIVKEHVQVRGGVAKDCWVIAFTETPKLFIVNKTNAETIAKATGTEQASEWVGKRITLYPTKTECKGETVDCIRIRPKTKEQA